MGEDDNNIIIMFDNDSDKLFTRIYDKSIIGPNGVYTNFVDLSKSESRWLLNKLKEKLDD